MRRRNMDHGRVLWVGCSRPCNSGQGWINGGAGKNKNIRACCAKKPFEIEEMEVKVQKALELRRMQHEIDYLRHAQGGIYEFDNIIG